MEGYTSSDFDNASPEIRALQHHVDSFLLAMTAIDLAKFSWTLYSKGMIMASDVEKVNLTNSTMAEKSSTLLLAIRSGIDADVGLFKELVVSLKEERIEIARKLESTCGKLL